MISLFLCCCCCCPSQKTVIFRLVPYTHHKVSRMNPKFRARGKKVSPTAIKQIFLLPKREN